MSKLKRRMVFDLLITVMLVFEMFYQFTGNFLHEVVGFAFFACIVVHLLLSRRWISSTAGLVGKKKMNGRRKGLAVMALLLAADLLVLMLSSVIISNVLWGFGVNLSVLNPGDVWVPLHSASAYGLCVLTLAHLAMHWVQVAGVMKIEYDPSRRRAIGQCVGAAVGIGAVALGVVGARQVGGSAAEVMTRALDSNNESEEGLPSADDVGAQRSVGAGESSSSTSADSAARSGSSSRGHGKRNGFSGSSANSDGISSQQQNSDSSGKQETAPESGSGNTGTVSGICTLCRKQCALSAPKCNKPYDAGLI